MRPARLAIALAVLLTLPACTITTGSEPCKHWVAGYGTGGTFGTDTLPLYFCADGAR